MYLTAYGIREWLGAGAIALALSAAWVWLALKGEQHLGYGLLVVTWLAWLAVAAFFRVPKRVIVADDNAITSPADGVVSAIETTTDHGIEHFDGRPLLRISIFLSVLDVHVNRAPCAFDVEYRHYRKGRFLDARDSRCAKENEAMTLAGTGHAGGMSFPVAVRQMSGAIARRIVCKPQVGDSLDKGEIYGMIKFGSRTDLYLDSIDIIKVTVSVGDKARAGTTQIGRIADEI